MYISKYSSCTYISAIQRTKATITFLNKSPLGGSQKSPRVVQLENDRKTMATSLAAMMSSMQAIQAAPPAPSPSQTLPAHAGVGSSAYVTQSQMDAFVATFKSDLSAVALKAGGYGEYSHHNISLTSWSDCQDFVTNHCPTRCLVGLAKSQKTQTVRFQPGRFV